jgi:hypothetical protein
MVQNSPTDLLEGALCCVLFGLGLLSVKSVLQRVYQGIERNTQSRPVRWIFGYKARTIVPRLRLAGITAVLMGVFLAVLALLKLRQG